MSNNQNIYSSVEFSNFAYRTSLLPEEEKLLNKYLIKDFVTVEAGTAGGRILFELKKMGFNSLHGFDFVKRFIEEAENKDVDKVISFSVQDASNLFYENETFDQAIYLQQILSNIEIPEKRFKAIKESYRILKKEGILLISFCSFESKQKDFISRIFISYLKILRKFKNKSLSIQSLPWLKHAGKPNWDAFCDKEPHNYWFRIEEIVDILNATGYCILAIGYPKNILDNTMKSSFTEFAKDDYNGHIYFVCKKK